ncbi:MAG TPA: YwmB family TATA-box binding protein, partial [Bacillota bacterium]|nr:YwmB family TATA-box binding protein [Bacillota bacterium]
IFDALEGKIIEGIEEEYLVSKTGYSSLIENCLYVDGEKMNLNLALRYKEFEDATYIWLGTPVIFSSY